MTGQDRTGAEGRQTDVAGRESELGEQNARQNYRVEKSSILQEIGGILKGVVVVGEGVQEEKPRVVTWWMAETCKVSARMGRAAPVVVVLAVGGGCRRDRTEPKTFKDGKRQRQPRSRVQRRRRASWVLGVWGGGRGVELLML